jgi:hypothetical protein
MLVTGAVEFNWTRQTTWPFLPHEDDFCEAVVVALPRTVIANATAPQGAPVVTRLLRAYTGLPLLYGNVETLK